MLYNLFANRDFVSVFAVALLAEGVDRNDVCAALCFRNVGSPSSQRAWIEIYTLTPKTKYSKVALLAEGVDRNRAMSGSPKEDIGRPPRRGRG